MLFYDRLGWPVEGFIGKPMKTFIRRLLHTCLIQTWKKWKKPYWKCTNCSGIEWHEEEVWCWSCGKGEMIYRG